MGKTSVTAEILRLARADGAQVDTASLFDELGNRLLEALTGDHPEAAAQELREALKGEQVSPEGRHIISSYLTVFSLDHPILVTTVFAMFGEQERIQRTNMSPHGEDFLRRKIAQLERLHMVNPRFRWELIVVNDGDDTRLDRRGVLPPQTSLDLAAAIARAEYAPQLKCGQIQLMALPQEAREAMGSRKGGAILWAVQKRLSQAGAPLPDFICYTDADISVPLDLEGWLLHHLLGARGIGAAAGSSRVKGGRTLNYSWLRFFFSRAFNRLARLLLPLGPIADTQLSFKIIPTEIMQQVLPVHDEDAFDPAFNYDMSFDNDLLARIRVAGYDIAEVPTVWRWSKYSTLRWYHALWMVWGLLRSVVDIRSWRTARVRTVQEILLLPADERTNHLERILGPQPPAWQVKAMLGLLLTSEAYTGRQVQRRLSQTDRVALLAQVLGLALRRPDARSVAAYLEDLLARHRTRLLPDAERLVRSSLAVFHIEHPTKVALVVTAFRIQDRMEGVRTKLKQMEDLFGINPAIAWELILSCTPDDAPQNPGLTSAAALKQTFGEGSARVRIVEMDALTAARLQSLKGGSIILGLADAIIRGADIAAYMDLVPMPHAGQLGLLLGPIIRDPNVAVIGSRRLPQSIGFRVWFRRATSYLFNKWVWALVPTLRDIHDTQAPFKAFSGSLLARALPVDPGTGRLDPDFDYGFSFDVNLLQRVRENGGRLEEVPYIDAYFMSGRLADHPVLTRYGPAMLSGVRRQAERDRRWRGRVDWLGGGFEYVVYGHPALALIIKIPRWAAGGFFYSVGRKVRSFTSAPDETPFMISAATIRRKGLPLVTSLSQALDDSSFFRPYFRAFLGGLKADDKRPLAVLFQAQERLGGLVTPFIIQENVEFQVMLPLAQRASHYAYLLLRMMSQGLRWLFQRAWRMFDATAPWFGPLITRGARFLWPVVQPLWALFVGVIEFLVWKALPTVWRWTKPFLARIFLRFNDLFVWVSRIAGKIRRWFTLAFLAARQFSLDALAWLLRRVPLLDQFIRWVDFRTRRWVRATIIGLIRVKRWLDSWIAPVLIYPRVAILAEKVQPLGPVLAYLDQQGRQQEARDLIDKFFELEEALYRRGFADLDSVLWNDIGLTKEGDVVLLDLGVLTNDRAEALGRPRPEVMEHGSSFHLDMLRRRLSPGLVDYYLVRSRKIFSPENILRLWGQEQGRPIQFTAPVPEFAVGRSLAARLATRFDRLVALMAQDTRPAGPGVPAAGSRALVFDTALRLGTPEERMIARDILAVSGAASGLALVPALPPAEAATLRTTDPTEPDARRRIVTVESVPVAISENRTTIPEADLRTVQEGLAENDVVLYSHAGLGTRMGLLSLREGDKAHIRLLGRTIKDWSAVSSRWLAAALPETKKWLISYGVDTLLLSPTAQDLSAIKQAASQGARVIFFAKSAAELDALSPKTGAGLAARVLAALINGLPRDSRLKGDLQEVWDDFARNAQGRSAVLRHGGNDVLSHWIIEGSVASAYLAHRVQASRAYRSAFTLYRLLHLPYVAPRSVWRSMWRPAEGFTAEEWEALWTAARQINRADIAVVAYPGPWMNLNTPIDILNVYRALVSPDADWKARFRILFGLPIDASLVESTLEGNVTFLGEHLLYKSRIVVPPGVTLRIGPGFVADESTLVFAAPPGTATEFTISANTVFSQSTVQGPIHGGEDSLIYGVRTDTGLSFGSRTLYSTLPLSTGEILVRQPLGPVPNDRHPTPGWSVYNPTSPFVFGG